MRPNYYIFMGYLRKMKENQQGEPPHLYTYEYPFQKSWIRHWHASWIRTKSNQYLHERKLRDNLAPLTTLALKPTVVSGALRSESIYRRSWPWDPWQSWLWQVSCCRWDPSMACNKTGLNHGYLEQSGDRKQQMRSRSFYQIPIWEWNNSMH